jgi:hypothetical protein
VCVSECVCVCVCVCVSLWIVAVSVVSIEAHLQYCIRASRASREKSVYRRVFRLDL